VGLLDSRWHLSDLTRAGALVGLLVACGIVTFRLLIRPLRRRLDDLDLALRVEAHYPNLNDALASTVEFLDPSSDGSGVSAAQRPKARRALKGVCPTRRGCSCGWTAPNRSNGRALSLRPTAERDWRLTRWIPATFPGVSGIEFWRTTPIRAGERSNSSCRRAW